METPQQVNEIRAEEISILERTCDLALLPPTLLTVPLPEKYLPANETFAMNNGVAVTRSGRIWVNWIGGGDSPDAYSVAAYSDDGGRTFQPPALAVDGHSPTLPIPRSNIIGNLWVDPAGRLHHFISQSLWHNDGRMGVWETVCDNPDAAVPPWSPLRRLCDGAALNKPIVLANGTWLLPVELAQTWGPWRGLFGSDNARAFLLASADGGCTWSPRGMVEVPDSDWPENNVLELPGGRLRMYFRSRKGLLASGSDDGGHTWGSVARAVGMDNPCARCQVRRLASGRWIFVKHLAPPDSFNDNRRVGIIAYLSDDFGATWQGGLVLDDRPGTSYPDVAQDEAGRIYVTHDFERGREAEIILHIFSEEDILLRQFASPSSAKGIVAMKALATAHNRGKA